MARRFSGPLIAKLARAVGPIRGVVVGGRRAGQALTDQISRVRVEQRADRCEQVGELGVRIVVIRTGAVSVDNEQGLKLVALCIFRQLRRLGRLQHGQIGLVQPLSRWWVPQPPVPCCAGCPGADRGVLIMAHHTVECAGQPVEIDLRAGHDRVGPHHKRRGDLFACQVASLVVRGEYLLPAVVVKQRLTQTPAGRFTDHFHGIVYAI
jgi:hypothetical protein